MSNIEFYGFDNSSSIVSNKKKVYVLDNNGKDQFTGYSEVIEGNHVLGVDQFINKTDQFGYRNKKVIKQYDQRVPEGCCVSGVSFQIDKKSQKIRWLELKLRILDDKDTDTDRDQDYDYLSFGIGKRVKTSPQIEEGDFSIPINDLVTTILSKSEGGQITTLKLTLLQGDVLRIGRDEFNQTSKDQEIKLEGRGRIIGVHAQCKGKKKIFVSFF